MIYIRSLEEMSQVLSIQEYEENLEQPEKEKQLSLVRKLNKSQKNDG